MPRKPDTYRSTRREAAKALRRLSRKNGGVRPSLASLMAPPPVKQEAQS